MWRAGSLVKTTMKILLSLLLLTSSAFADQFYLSLTNGTLITNTITACSGPTLIIGNNPVSFSGKIHSLNGLTNGMSLTNENFTVSFELTVDGTNWLRTNAAMTRTFVGNSNVTFGTNFTASEVSGYSGIRVANCWTATTNIVTVSNLTLGTWR